jgi:antitoxin Phd
MKVWRVQDAKARFSEMLDACVAEGPQLVTKRGAETAVLVPMDQWRRMRDSDARTFKELLMADEPRFDLEIPPRGRYRHRKPPVF